MQDDDKKSEEIIEELENIDDECAELDIDFVMIDDAATAKKYGVKSPPGLVFFRRGKHIKYEGDLSDEEAVLEWLTNKDNLENADIIEKVSNRSI